MKKTRLGFTLLEVMVALMVIAIALAALIKSDAEGTRQFVLLRDKTLAHWAGMNVIQALRLEPTPPVGVTTGETKMAGQTFYWRREVSGTPDPNLRRVELQVFEDERRTRPLTRLVLFMAEFPKEL